jgi:hypothetical protein
MGNITYYLALGLDRDPEGEPVAFDPMEVQSSVQAISRARSLAAMKAGAIAFSRTDDPDFGAFEDAKVLWPGGEVPADAMDTQK